MDAIVRDVLQFDRFELDLGLACLRIGGETVDLRPKAFAVLKLLAENAGRLVSKDTLTRTVWPDISVGDDSLSQCIHELRQVLGDKDHRLIKTVSRRGYVLDAKRGTVATALPPNQTRSAGRWRTVGAGVLVVCALGIAVLSISDARQPIQSLLDRWMAGTDNLMSTTDMQRVAALAASKELPLPAYRIHSPPPDVAESTRRFLGVWVTDTGWINSNRQFMMIVTNVWKDGSFTGYLVNGPAKLHSRVPGPAFSGTFAGHIENGTLRYDGNSGMHLASFMPDGRIEFRLAYQDGTVGVALLSPAWTSSDDALRVGAAASPAQPKTP